jgi:hypothetical protein
MIIRPEHLTLGEVISRLQQERDQTRVLPVGFHDPHSWRGYYQELAFCVTENISVGEMLRAADSAVDAHYEGYRGKVYKMTDLTQTYLVVDHHDGNGEQIGSLLLDLMLKQPGERPLRQNGPLSSNEMHALLTHPDYDYMVTTGDMVIGYEADQWVRNPHVDDNRAHWMRPAKPPRAG